jgi:biopolymer transport protein ExbD
MKRLSVQVAVAVMMFVVGAEFHQLVISATDLALTYYTVRFEEPASSPIDLSAAAQTFLDRKIIVICLADKRDLYLGKRFVGTPDDTRELEADLRHQFALSERELNELERRGLSRMIRGAPAYRLVYVKAFTGASYGDVVRVYNAARRAGAWHIGLVADRRKKGAN